VLLINVSLIFLNILGTAYTDTVLSECLYVFKASDNCM